MRNTPFSSPAHVEPASFSERALSRRQFLRTAGATGAVLASGLWLPSEALAAGADPKPIPGGNTAFGVFIHHFPAVIGNELSKIYDFDGLLGDTRITGEGTGKDTKTGKTTRLLFQVDMGFMKGLYVGQDGRRRQGTFAFV
jgi:hypothetical protein